MKELVNLRKEKEKHYLNEDGTITAYMFNEDIHYLDNGEYKEIDNSLIEESEYITNKNNDFKIKLFKNRYLVNIDLDHNGYLNITLKNGLGVYSKLNDNEIIYEKVLPNVDFHYLIHGKSLKENIYLKEKINTSIIFNMETNLKLVLENNKVLAKNNNKIVYTFEPPFMVDRNNNTNSNCSYKLKRTDNNYELELNLDQGYLNTANYPVIVDPTIIGAELGVYDTFIYPNDTNVERNNLDYLKIGVDSNNICYRSLIKFDLPTLATGSEVIGANAVLTSHKCDYKAADYVHDKVSIHQITTPWSEQNANWESLHDKYNPYIEGITELLRTETQIENSELILVAKYNYIDITNLVKKWYSGEENNGFMLKFYNEVYNENCSEYYMFSKNNTMSEDPKPALVITYRNQNGINDYMTYNDITSTSYNCFINNYNGNITNIFPIAELENQNDSISLNLIYNTNDVLLNEYGISNLGVAKGWKFNFEQRLYIETISEKEYLKYLDNTGTIHYFCKDNESEKYKDEDGLNLTIYEENGFYFMLDLDKNKYKFGKLESNQNYFTLLSMVDRNNIETTFSYESLKLTSINNEKLGNISISYNETGVTVTRLGKNNTLKIENDKLTKIEFPEYNVYFEYNENDCVKCITDVDNTKYSFEYYDKSFKIKKVFQLGSNGSEGRFLSFQYRFNTTSVVDEIGKKYVYIFNNLGKTISTVAYSNGNNLKDSFGFSSKYIENSIGNTNNKKKSQTMPLKYINNLLNYGDFSNNNRNFSIGDCLLEANEYGENRLKVEIGEQNVFNFTPEEAGYYTVSFSLKSNSLHDIPVRLYTIVDEMSVQKDGFSIQKEEVKNEYVMYSTTGYFNDGETIYLDLYMIEAYDTYIRYFQLEKGKIANMQNLVTNSDFSYSLTDWNISGFSSDDGQELTNYYEVVNISPNEAALKIKSNPDGSISLFKNFDIPGKKGDVYYLSFWYKNEGYREDSDNYVGNSANICFYNVNEEEGSEPYIIKLNKNPDEWQFFSSTFVAETDYDSFSLNIVSQFEANNLYVTNFTLVKEFGEVLIKYDAEGNIISMSDYKTLSDENEYQDNNLISTITKKKQIIGYEYNNNNDLIAGYSDSGIDKRHYYDSFGNEIKTVICSHNKDDLNISGNYNIRLYGYEKYLSYNPETKKIIIKDYECNKNVFKISKENQYKISPIIIDNYFINTINNELYLAKTPFEFDLELNNDHSFKFKCNINSNDKYVRVDDDNNVILTENEKEASRFYLEDINNEKVIKSEIKYSEDGKEIIAYVDALGNKILFDYDEETGMKKSVIKNNQITSYKYNDNYKVSEIELNNRKIVFEYNEKNLISNIITNNTKYHFDYDEFFRKNKIFINDQLFLEHEYSVNNGNLNKTTYSNGKVIEYEYDDFDRITRIIFEDYDQKYYYNNKGKIGRIEKGNTIYNYQYDFYDRVVRNSIKEDGQVKDFRITSKYDNAGNLTKKNYSFENKNRDIIYNHNSHNIIESIDFGDFQENNIYDYLGRLTKKTINDITYEYSYLSSGNNTSMFVKNYLINEEKYEYKYDNNYNIIEVKKDGDVVNSYTYDALNELICEVDYNNEYKITYSYDTNGNMLQKSRYDLNDNIIETNTFEYSHSYLKNALTSFDGKVIEYDSIGNPISIDNYSLIWKNGNQLTSIYNDENTIEYSYNINSLREKKIINNVETKYYYDDNDLIAEISNSQILYFIRDEFKKLVGFELNNTRYFYKKNIMDDIIGIIDSNGEQIANYQYDAWGNIISIKDKNGDIINDSSHVAYINPFRYRSYYYDEETGFYYLNERYYSPQLYRFLNQDTFIGAGQDILSYNTYIYCSNNPVFYSDSKGNFGLGVLIAGTVIGGALIGAGSVLVSDVVKSVKKGKLDFSSPADYIGSAVGGSVSASISVFAKAPITGTAVGTIVKNVTTSAIKGEKIKSSKWAKKTTEDTLVSVITAGVTNKVKINGFNNSSRSSFDTVFKRGVTNTTRNSYQMSFKVAGKGFATEAFSSAVSIPVENGVQYTLSHLPDDKSNDMTQKYYNPLLENNKYSNLLDKSVNYCPIESLQ